MDRKKPKVGSVNIEEITQIHRSNNTGTCE